MRAAAAPTGIVIFNLPVFERDREKPVKRAPGDQDLLKFTRRMRDMVWGKPFQRNAVGDSRCPSLGKGRIVGPLMYQGTRIRIVSNTVISARCLVIVLRQLST